MNQDRENSPADNLDRMLVNLPGGDMPPWMVPAILQRIEQQRRKRERAPDAHRDRVPARTHARAGNRDAVGADAEEHRVRERHDAGVAEQQVVGPLADGEFALGGVGLASAAGAAEGSMAFMAETSTDCRSKEKTGEAQQASNTAERNFIIYTPGDNLNYIYIINPDKAGG